MFDTQVSILLAMECTLCLCICFLCKLCVYLQEYKRKQMEEQHQAERLQRQLQQERAYLVSLHQQQQQEPRPQDNKQLYHYKDTAPNNDKPAWAKEVLLIHTALVHGFSSCGCTSSVDCNIDIVSYDDLSFSLPKAGLMFSEESEPCSIAMSER